MIEMIDEYIVKAQTWTLWDTISYNMSDYKDLLKALRDAEENDVINIDIESPGGSCDTGFKIIQHIRECRARVNIYVSGTPDFILPVP